MTACVQSLSHTWFFVTPWTVACQPPLSMGFPRQEYWSGLPFPSSGDLPNPGIEFLHLLHWQADSLPLSHLRSPETLNTFIRFSISIIAFLANFWTCLLAASFFFITLMEASFFIRSPSGFWKVNSLLSVKKKTACSLHGVYSYFEYRLVIWDLSTRENVCGWSEIATFPWMCILHTPSLHWYKPVRFSKQTELIVVDCFIFPVGVADLWACFKMKKAWVITSLKRCGIRFRYFVLILKLVGVVLLKFCSIHFLFLSF